MKERVLLDKAEIPEGGKEFRLYQHDKDFTITSGRAVLMSSRAHESEDALGSLVTEKLKDNKEPRILIGGLGMGFTLSAALKGLPRKAQVVVAELVPVVVKWCRGVLARVADYPLSDPRVDVRVMDAARLISQGKLGYDAILLDIDNGPSGLSRKANVWFYSPIGLKAIMDALRPSGIFALWSAGPEVRFTRQLQKAGFTVEEVRVRARPGQKGAHHFIWLASKKKAVDEGTRRKKGEKKKKRKPQKGNTSKRGK